MIYIENGFEFGRYDYFSKGKSRAQTWEILALENPVTSTMKNLGVEERH